MKQHKYTIACAAVTLAMTVAIAQDIALPMVQKSGAVEFISGGVGEEQSAAFKSASARWPLTLEFAAGNPGAANAVYAADVQVALRNSQQQLVLQTTSNGPFLLVKLPPGRYQVDAVFEGRNVQRHVTVVKGQPVKSVFMWPPQA